jgi:hypothetical protein
MFRLLGGQYAPLSTPSFVETFLGLSNQIPAGLATALPVPGGAARANLELWLFVAAFCATPL